MTSPTLPDTQSIKSGVALRFDDLGDHIVRRIGIGASNFESTIFAPIGSTERVEQVELRDAWDQAVLTGAVPETIARNGRAKDFRYVDLFAGCGGLSYGVQQAAYATGFNPVSEFAADIDAHALEIYRQNINVKSCEVMDLADGQVSFGGGAQLLIGGPPCQGHSNLNNHTRRLDERDELYLEMPRFAVAHDIPLVAIENVPAIVSSYKSIIDRARSIFDEHKYRVDEVILDASKLGVAQTRKRHFMFASRIKLPDIRAIVAELATEPRPLEWAIGDLRELGTSSMDQGADLSETNRHRIREMFENDWYQMPDHLRPPSHRNGHSYSAVYGRMWWDKPASTITTRFVTPGCGRFIHPLEQRTLTLHEGARVQGFPDDFDFLVPNQQPVRQRLTRAIGNAVPPPLGFVVGIWAIDALISSGEI